MALRFMLDTDICIFFRSGRPRPVMDHVARLLPGEAAMSVVTYGELRLGAEKSPDRDRAIRSVDNLLKLLPVESIAWETARDYAAIRSHLERRGEIIGSNDLWIAAHARSTGLTLVTNNEREFRRVPGLKVENWATT